MVLFVIRVEEIFDENRKLAEKGKIKFQINNEEENDEFLHRYYRIDNILVLIQSSVEQHGVMLFHHMFSRRSVYER